MCYYIEAILSSRTRMSSSLTLIDVMTGVTVEEHSRGTLASVCSSLVLALCAYIAGMYVF